MNTIVILINCICDEAYLVPLIVRVDLPQLIFEFREAIRHAFILRVQFSIVAVVGVKFGFVASTLFDGGDVGVLAGFGRERHLIYCGFLFVEFVKF